MSVSSQSGFSLPLVLLVTGALAGAAVLASIAARGNVRGIAAGTGTAQAEALADAGIALALLDLELRHDGAAKAAPARAPRWRRDCQIAPAILRLASQDEGGKIDLNYADARLLRALFVGLGEPQARAQRLADAIIDFRDADDTPQPLGAERNDYLEAGRSAGPKNARLSDISEVRAVLGMTPEIADRIAPFVTVHSARDGIDPDVADTALVTLLARGDGEAGAASTSSGDGPSLTSRDTPLPAAFVQRSLRRFFTITADAALPTARFVRETIVDTGAQTAPAAGGSPIASRYRFWSWRRSGTPIVIDAATSSSNLPPC